MKAIRFPGFRVNVPENPNENYTYCGNASKKVKDIVRELNNKKVILNPVSVANMVKQEVHQNFTEII